MSRRSQRRGLSPEPQALQWSDFPRVYWIAMVVAIVLGALSGVVWITWNLAEQYLLR